MRILYRHFAKLLMAGAIGCQSSCQSVHWSNSTSEGNAVIINHDGIARAEKVIKQYVGKQYAWNENVYEITIDSKPANQDIVVFRVSHQDDKHATAPGAGKSFLVKFDMQKMEVVQEIVLQ